MQMLECLTVPVHRRFRRFRQRRSHGHDASSEHAHDEGDKDDEPASFATSMHSETDRRCRGFASAASRGWCRPARRRGVRQCSSARPTPHRTEARSRRSMPRSPTRARTSTSPTSQPRLRRRRHASTRPRTPRPGSQRGEIIRARDARAEQQGPAILATIWQ